MKRSIIVLCIVAAAVSVAFLSCVTTSASFEPVVQGRTLSQPVDLQKLKKAIEVSLADFNWEVKSDTETVITAEFTKDGGKVSAQIKVTYSKSGYAIEYVDSVGLNVDLKEKTIHRNYVRWINNLDKQIYVNYVQ